MEVELVGGTWCVDKNLAVWRSQTCAEKELTAGQKEGPRIRSGEGFFPFNSKYW